jgi:hypothetical protein
MQEGTTMNTQTTKNSANTDLLAIFRTGRSFILDNLASEQAILNRENETDMTDEDAAEINSASFQDRGERNFFKNSYRRHARNIAEGNRFYT